ncbi:MAG: hypothetical protein MUQ32_12515, partial [Chloroflexi bacterium]|nr:hypothetical protein [Chloroflexota bacterium]
TVTRSVLRLVVPQPWARKAALYGVTDEEFTQTGANANQDDIWGFRGAATPARTGGRSAARIQGCGTATRAGKAGLPSARTW